MFLVCFKGTLANLKSSAKLGPRLIPHFRDIVSQAIVVLRDGPEGMIGSVELFFATKILFQVLQ